MHEYQNSVYTVLAYIRLVLVGVAPIRGRVLFCSNNATVRGLIGACGLIEEIVIYGSRERVG